MNGKVFFAADTHFGDDRIIKYENRPFADADEMDRVLIEKWNSVVSDNDSVFLLGDFSSYALEKSGEICRRLNGRKFLVMGHHDTFNERQYSECGFEGVSRYPIIYENFWILSHEPLYVNKNMPYANIFGHFHANPIYKTISEQSFCVSIERIGYTPIEFEDIKQKIRETDPDLEEKNKCHQLLKPKT